MKTILLSTTSAIIALALSNCSAPAGPNTQRGAVTGGLLGAGTGAIVGHQSGRTVEGALLGGAIGGGAGALYGNNQDKQQGY